MYACTLYMHTQIHTYLCTYMPTSGSRHSSRGANLICFPVTHIYFFVGAGPKFIAKLDWGGQWPNFPPPWIRHCTCLHSPCNYTYIRGKCPRGNVRGKCQGNVQGEKS